MDISHLEEKTIYGVIVILIVINMIFLSLLIIQTKTLKEKTFLLEIENNRNEYHMKTINNLTFEIGTYEEQTRFCITGILNPIAERDVS